MDCLLVIDHLRAAIVALQSADSANCLRHIDTARAALNDHAAPTYRQFYDYRKPAAPVLMPTVHLCDDDCQHITAKQADELRGENRW